MSDERDQGEAKTASWWIRQAVQGFMHDRGVPMEDDNEVRQALVRFLIESMFLLVVEYDVPASVLRDSIAYALAQAEEAATMADKVTAQGGDA